MRERVARIALLAYPSTVRAPHADEMLATLLDASAGSRIAYGRELAGLIRHGLRARGRATADAGMPRVIADGFCLAGVWILTLGLSTLLSQRLRGMHDPLLAAPSIALLGVVLLLALIGYDRVAGAGALVWTALRLPELLHAHPGSAGIAPEVLPVVCFAVLLLAPRRRAVDLRRAGWLAVPALLVATLGPQDGSPLLLAAVALAAILVVASAAALLPADPRLAIAGAVPTTCLGIQVAADPGLATVLLIAAAPAVLAVTVVHGRHLRTAS
jgi:hypothetical protein